MEGKGVKQNNMNLLPVSGDGANDMEASKDHHSASHQKQKSKHFCPLHLGVRVTKETQCSQALDETMFFLQREDIEQAQLWSWALVPQANRCLLEANAGQLTDVYPMAP